MALGWNKYTAKLLHSGRHGTEKIIIKNYWWGVS